MRAERSGNGFRLSGSKQFVVQGASADVILVAAQHRRRASPCSRSRRTPKGLEVEGVRLADSSIGARLTFDKVEVDADAVIGEVGGGGEVLTRVLNAGRAGAAAELVGVGSAAMDMTVDYLKQRKQFGRLIGEFQALQHRAAHLYSELEIARAATLKAQQLLDEGSADAEAMVSVAKAKAGRASTLAVQEGVQMHGGIGMTDEYRHRPLHEARPRAERAVRRRQLPRRQAGADEGLLDFPLPCREGLGVARAPRAFLLRVPPPDRGGTRPTSPALSEGGGRSRVQGGTIWWGVSAQ